MGIVPGVNIVLAMLGVAGVIPMTWFGLAFGLFVIGSFGTDKDLSAICKEFMIRNYVSCLSTPN